MGTTTRALLLTGAFLIVSLGLAAAQTVRLVPSQFATIGAAMTVALPNDIILVAPGTYRENLD